MASGGSAVLGKAVLEIGTDTRELQRDLAGIKKKAQATGRDVKSIASNLNLVVWAKFGQIAGRALLKVGAAAVELGRRGAVVADVASGFEVLTRQINATSGSMLGALREGVKGTVTDFDLMTLANKALGAGIVKNEADMRTLAEGARALAKRVGGDTKQSFETLTTAIASGRTAQLKQVGLFVDNKVAVEEFAAANRKSVGDLSDAERAQALAGATLETLRSNLLAAAPPAADFGEVLDRAQTRVKNFTDGLAVAVSESPVVTAGLRAMGDAFDQALGVNQEANVKALLGALESMAIAVLQVAQVGVGAARVLGNAFSGAKVIFNAWLELVFTGIAKANSLLATLADKASALPVVGEAFSRLQGVFQGAADAAGSLAFGFGEMRDQALESAAGTNAALDTVQTALAATEQAMRDAQAAAAEGGAAATAALTEQANAAAVVATNAAAQTSLALEQERLAMTTQTQFRAMDAEAQAAIAGAKDTAITASAAAAFTTVTDLANAAGFQTRSQLQLTAATAKFTFESMRRAGTFSAQELQKAFVAAEEAKRAATDETLQGQLTATESWASGVQGVLGALGQKNKTAATAGALISTYQGVAKALASAPWPANLPLAAGALAAGLLQVRKIRASEPGYQRGTPRLDFADFGGVTTADLHGREAIIPQGGGHQLAGEIASSMPGEMAGGAQVTALLERIAEGVADLPFALRRAVREAALKGVA